MGNEYCNVEEIESFNYPKWNSYNAIRWKIPWFGGDEYLFAYKDDFIRHHQNFIKIIAKRNHIPADLLASVAWVEAGGMPDGIKDVVFEMRRFDWSGPDWVDNNMTVTKRPSLTSIGIIAMQIEVASREFNNNNNMPTMEQQLQIKECLSMDTFNIEIVAKHLRNLIFYDYPGINTSNLTDEQFILAGSRYNRGTQRNKQDFIDSLKADQSNVTLRSYTSYGRAMFNRLERIRRLLNE